MQVYHDGVWGGICDDEWGEAEAEIACKELGFSRGAVGPTHSSQFGYSPRIIWMDNGPVANICLSAVSVIKCCIYWVAGRGWVEKN